MFSSERKLPSLLTCRTAHHRSQVQARTDTYSRAFPDVPRRTDDSNSLLIYYHHETSGKEKEKKKKGNGVMNNAVRSQYKTPQ